MSHVVIKTLNYSDCGSAVGTRGARGSIDQLIMLHFSYECYPRINL